MASSINIVNFLKAELARRRVVNTRYSLRSFASALNVNAGYLSRVLAGHTHLSVGAAKRICASLNLTAAETKEILASAANAAEARQLTRAIGGISEEPRPSATKELETDTYAVISDMHHYAILESTFLADFRPDPRWIAKRLGITALEVEFAIARLLRLGLLKKENGTLKKTDSYLTTKDKSVTNPALKKSQRQILRLARLALDRDQIETRSATGMTMAIDPAKVPLAKQMIQTFMEQLCSVLESGERKEVYQLGVNLFALTSPSRLAEVLELEGRSDSTHEEVTTAGLRHESLQV
jgi:uncharacterized protein (TIGR02147 family)